MKWSEQPKVKKQLEKRERDNSQIKKGAIARFGKGAEIRFDNLPKNQIQYGVFLRKNGGYHYFQVGSEKEWVRELYSLEFEIVQV